MTIKDNNSGQMYKITIENNRPCLHRTDKRLGVIVSMQLAGRDDIIFEVMEGIAHHMLTIKNPTYICEK